MRDVRLLVAVRGLSGRTYPVGTVARTGSRGGVVDAFVGGDWLPLSWWEFAETTHDELAFPPAREP